MSSICNKITILIESIHRNTTLKPDKLCLFHFNASLVNLNGLSSIPISSRFTSSQNCCVFHVNKRRNTRRVFPRGKTLARRQSGRFLSQQSPTEITQTRTHTIRHLTPRLDAVFLLTLFLAAGNVQPWGFFFMMSDHKMIHVSYFWTLVYATLSTNNKLHISLRPWRRFFSCALVQKPVHRLHTHTHAPNRWADVLVMWPIQPGPAKVCPSISPGGEIGHRAGRWIWVAFIILESWWVTSSLQMNRTSWTEWFTGTTHWRVHSSSTLIQLCAKSVSQCALVVIENCKCFITNFISKWNKNWKKKKSGALRTLFVVQKLCVSIATNTMFLLLVFLAILWLT